MLSTRPKICCTGPVAGRGVRRRSGLLTGTRTSRTSSGSAPSFDPRCDRPLVSLPASSWATSTGGSPTKEPSPASGLSCLRSLPPRRACRHPRDVSAWVRSPPTRHPGTSWASRITSPWSTESLDRNGSLRRPRGSGVVPPSNGTRRRILLRKPDSVKQPTVRRNAMDTLEHWSKPGALGMQERRAFATLLWTFCWRSASPSRKGPRVPRPPAGRSLSELEMVRKILSQCEESSTCAAVA